MSRRDSNQVDLTNCDREPIHQLGLIQPFGALLAVTKDWIVAHYSENAADVLALDEPLQQGGDLAELLDPEAIQVLKTQLDSFAEDGSVERLFGLRLTTGRNQFDVAVHHSGNLILIEIEPHDTAAMAESTSLLRPVMDRLRKADGVGELCERAARQMKRLLGYDRVMVYRFHPDGSGEVIAEAREPQLEAFLGLRYPRTDIPAQARELYLRNLFRIIGDVNAEPVPIQPEFSIDGEPVDLSMATLRAVSPIHIEYLKNMGVSASLSISIVVKGKLWGLFACHHYSARILPYSRRTVAELFSQLFSLQLDIELANTGNLLAHRAKELHDSLMSRLAGGGSLPANLTTLGEVVEPVIAHDGSSVIVDGEYMARGSAPTEEEFRALLPALNTRSTSDVLATEALAENIPAAQAFADRAVGALVIPVSRRPRDYVVLWRRELQQVVTWAGNPEKPANVGPHGDRLTPRESFAAWRESVRGRSSTWTEEELSFAENLRVSLLEVILRVTEDAMEERARHQKQQELLIAELNHRVRNILTLIRGLVGQSRGEASDMAEFAGMIDGRIRALSMAHDNITREQWSPASLHELVLAEADAYLSEKADRVRISGPDVLIAPEAYTVLALVLHEMMTNSAKYGALCDSGGKIELQTAVTQSGDCEIHWREIGGPPVKAPERRGFGTTIIERSIPFELRGEANVRYELSGVAADFTIPARFVSETAKGKSADGTSRSGTDGGPKSGKRAAKGLERTIRKVLLVEDSVIIALDAEEALASLGVTEIMVCNSVSQALARIEEEPPQLGLLDYNLGQESSEPIANDLAARGIPFFFVTGYGEAVEKMAGASALGILQKPYTANDLLRLIEQVERSEQGEG